MSEEKLSKEQRKAIALLSVGRFLESFDFCLYLHMSVILNALFFPPIEDPSLKSFLTSFGFASSFLFMPFGSVFLGYLGDRFGRSSIIVLTTMCMALCCVTLATLPTYAQIGITAAVIVTVCRMLQSVTMIAECVGTEIYITEAIKPPMQYPAVAYAEVFGALGNIVALGVGAAFTNIKFFSGSAMEYSWRGAFLFGAVVGLVGTTARKSLKEAVSFSNRQALFKEKFSEVGIKLNLDTKGLYSKKPAKTYVVYFLMKCSQPVSMYFAYFYFGDLLAEKYNFSLGQVISNNLLVAFADFFGLMCLAQLSYKIHPLKLIKAKTLICLSIVAFFPLIMNVYPSSWVVLFFQCVVGMLAFDQLPATPIFYKYFPPFRRFTYSSFFLSSAQLLMYGALPVCTAFLKIHYGYMCVLLIMIPMGICFFFAASFFEKREKENLLNLAQSPN
jgi:MHS family proline/betaine transporter-like MFS transporter